MNIMQINCNAGHRYFVRIRVPEGDQLVPPSAAGQVTGIVATFTETKTGAAIDPDLEELPATEYANDPALFYVDVSQALHQEHLLPLGRGKPFFVRWSKPGVSDYQVDSFRVAIGTDV